MTPAWRQVGAVLVVAGRLWLRHWPMLLTLAFLAMALRRGALWAAVEVSDQHALVAQAVLQLAPLGYLLGVISMLLLLGRDLPGLRELSDRSGPVATTERRERRLVDVAVSFLVPFLAVYVSSGLLEEDRLAFFNAAAFDEFNQVRPGVADAVDFGGRLGLDWGFAAFLGIVVVAWTARWALGRFERRTEFVALAFVGALVEVFYTGQGSRYLVAVENQGQGWLAERRAVALVESRYDSVLEAIGPLAGPVERVVSFLSALVGSLDAVVVVPLAWLTVAAVVLGHKLSGPEEPEEPAIADGEGPRPARTARHVVGSGLRALLADVSERFSALWGSLKLLAGAGLAPMLAFGLVFLVALRVPLLVSYAWRQVAGPTETDTWLAFEPWESALGQAVSLVVLVPLLAAAVEWVVTARAVDPDVSPVPGGPGSPEARSGSAPR
ncbi:hypothetical protein SAMN04489844_3058 [Nocardioides exalbidus]|uniref:Uncharacterized protein n=1 Tax=Nocardioides exalbidus TaxID=402596 RepID=A0A1H4VME7_9ACTN|nr:hypothetical protein [Nocardioides exalbidus]SEC82196.1 hypothetical protein SAMN04489844_3058 [Nocardioides exalbidus]